MCVHLVYSVLCAIFSPSVPWLKSPTDMMKQRDEELDKKIVALRRKNEALMKRYQVGGMSLSLYLSLTHSLYLSLTHSLLLLLLLLLLLPLYLSNLTKALPNLLLAVEACSEC